MVAVDSDGSGLWWQWTLVTVDSGDSGLCWKWILVEGVDTGG